MSSLNISSRARSRCGCRAGRNSTSPSTGSFSIGAFEAFKAERYPSFFEKAYDILPADGRMLLHTILAHAQNYFHDNGIKLTISDLKFMRFIGTEIFPGGQLPRSRTSRARRRTPVSRWSACICCGRTTPAHSTCGRQNLAANRDEAIAITSEGGLRPLPALPDRVRRLLPPRYTNVGQFTLAQGLTAATGSGLGEPLLLGLDVEIGWLAKTSRGPSSASISNSVIASRLYHLRSHGTTCHGA